ncbi:MAG: GNAT family N-acetyltransferase [Clostridia bacterium]|nr:GNAT family N-acetyltransferase [Clostridia bacterium]
MLIRNATVGDICSIAELYISNHKSTYRGLVSDEYLDNLTVDSAVIKWSEYLSDKKNRIWVAFENDTFLGFLASMPDSMSEKIWYLDSLHICEGSRGKGIGSALIKTVGRYALKNGYDKMSVCVVKGNDSAKKLYIKLGARPLLSFEDKFDNSRVNSEKLLWDDLERFI